MIIYNKPNNTNRLGEERYCLKYLFEHDNAYLMDNHLAAAWCWMNRCDENTEYGFLHLDRHHDLCREGPTPIFNDLKALSIDDYLASTYVLPTGLGPQKYKSFSWNTYITKCFDLCPRWFSSTALIIKQYPEPQIRNQTPNFNYNIYSYKESLRAIHNCLSDNSRKWIVNIDIDYFFGGKHPDVVGAEVTNRFQNSTIRRFARAINQYYQNIQVLTIALSPECCGDMEKSLGAFKVFAEEIPALQGIVRDVFESGLPLH